MKKMMEYKKNEEKIHTLYELRKAWESGLIEV
jgi:hypothetical protein